MWVFMESLGIWDMQVQVSEAVVRKCFVKKVFLQISQNS